MSSVIATEEVVLPFRDGTIGVHLTGDSTDPPLGYLHGMLGNPGQPPFLAALAARTGQRVIAPCLPGFTPSPSRTELRGLYDWVVALSEIVDVAGLSGAPLVASSLGAMLAFELLAVRPEVFPAIVAIAPLGLWDDDEPIADVFAAHPREQPGLLLADPSKLDAFLVDDPGLGTEAAVAATVNRYRSRRAAASLIWPIPEHGLRSRLHRIECPVGLIWGQSDQVTPPSYADRWSHVLCRHVGTRLIADAGHCAEWDDPDQVADGVSELLGTTQDIRHG